MPPTRRDPKASSLFAPPGSRPMRDPFYLPTTRRAEGGYLSNPVMPISQLGAPSPYPGTRTARANTPMGGPYDTYLPRFQFGGYLPTVTRPSPRQTGAGSAWLPWDPNYYAQGPGGQLVGAMVEQAVENARAGVTGTGGGGGGTTGSRTWKPPPGVDAAWYNQFQKEHGETPEDYYGKTREGLSEALADREWSQGFQQMYGRAPSDDDWQAWWYSSRGREWAAMSKAERTEARREAKNKAQKGRDEWAHSLGWVGEKGGRRGAAWAMRQAVEAGWATWGQPFSQAQQTKEEQEKPEEPEKPPQYMPPQIVWR